MLFSLLFVLYAIFIFLSIFLRKELEVLNMGYKYNIASTNSTHIKQILIAEAQIAINELQIEDIQVSKYQVAKRINKITKHTQNPTKEEHRKLKTLQNAKRKLLLQYVR